MDARFRTADGFGMSSLRLGASLLLLSAFLWLSWLNWSVAWRSLVRRQPAPSWIPLLGGSLGALGVVAAPLPGAARIWWLPLLLDWGCAPGLLHALLYHALRKLRGR
jgi:hypothetical protein